ncbi:MAG: hypothetical protein H0U45_14500 [Tatlockia sp.]|jgi:hypothetical protein|nr:hypothetical protein [Tatlockia sp.]
MIFGLIAIVTGFGSIIAGKIGMGNFISDGTGAHKAGAWFGIYTGVGAVANSLAKNGKKQDSRSGCDYHRWVLNRPVFRKAIKDAWKRSRPNNPRKSHEVSGVLASVSNNGKVISRKDYPNPNREPFRRRQVTLDIWAKTDSRR